MRTEMLMSCTFSALHIFIRKVKRATHGAKCVRRITHTLLASIHVMSSRVEYAHIVKNQSVTNLFLKYVSHVNKLIFHIRSRSSKRILYILVLFFSHHIYVLSIYRRWSVYMNNIRTHNSWICKLLLNILNIPYMYKCLKKMLWAKCFLLENIKEISR